MDLNNSTRARICHAYLMNMIYAIGMIDETHKKHTVVGDDGELIEPDHSVEYVDLPMSHQPNDALLADPPTATPAISQSSDRSGWILIGAAIIVFLYFSVSLGINQIQSLAVTSTSRADFSATATSIALYPLPDHFSYNARTSATSPSVVEDVEWSSDGTRLAVSNYNSRTSIWDVANGGPALVLNRNTYQKLAWSPDGTRLVTSTNTGTMIWDATTGEQLVTLTPAENTTHALFMDWSFDGRYIAAVDSWSRNILTVYDAESGGRIQSFHTENWVNDEAIEGIAWTQGGLFALTHHNIIYWNITTWEHRIFQHLDQLNSTFDYWVSIGASADGRYLAVSKVSGSTYLRDGRMLIWDTSLNDEIRADAPPTITFPLVGTAPVYDITWSPDGSQLATRSFSSIYLWDVSTGERLDTIVFDDVIVDIDWSPSEQYLAVSSGDTVSIYSLAEGN
jgi:WD40 repeat protein